MKANIHPTWYPNAKFTCVCGNSFTAGSTQPQVQLEICSACHPFYTGEMKFIDTQGRVERFQARQQAVANKKYVKKQDRKRLLAKRQAEEEAEQPKTLKEMLQQSSKNK